MLNEFVIISCHVIHILHATFTTLYLMHQIFF